MSLEGQALMFECDSSDPLAGAGSKWSGARYVTGARSCGRLDEHFVVVVVVAADFMPPLASKRRPNCGAVS